MMSERTTVQAELKTTRQIAVRFNHAPSVKLTLQPRTEAPVTPPGVRILRLRNIVGLPMR